MIDILAKLTANAPAIAAVGAAHRAAIVFRLRPLPQLLVGCRSRKRSCTEAKKNIAGALGLQRKQEREARVSEKRPEGRDLQSQQLDSRNKRPHKRCLKD